MNFAIFYIRCFTQQCLQKYSECTKQQLNFRTSKNLLKINWANHETGGSDKSHKKTLLRLFNSHEKCFIKLGKTGVYILINYYKFVNYNLYITLIFAY